ncbi:GDSL-type esterase/lipase family protein [Marinomonas pollencensis]|uniref:Lysophospholipase L1-like esterase n=1 Tax=Marinomonas pollencensis TaxID=491954 RepID=A0A3E0DJ19_9GAMM|nr:GDSL-type esterase/lipase family protein [Marinomonas pollencensis]REG82613.1 lysophospholipase L1-like esterase [Marinomonas pollencensis]
MNNPSHLKPLSIVPVPQEVDWWLPRHEQKLAEKNAMESVDLVFLGDSITQGWEDVGGDVWAEYYAPLNALNLGFNGDRTEHLLWRLHHGAVDDIAPKLLVLLIGTNNTGHRQDAPEETAFAIQQIVSLLRSKLPQTKILLLGIFPRSAKPTQRLRLLNNEVNRLIATYDDGDSLRYLDIGDCFVDEEGRVRPEIMSDYLHLNASQYRVWAHAIAAYVSLYC